MTSQNTFESLNLPEQILKSLKQMGFTEPTPIQAAAIGPAISGKDLIGSAQTGTGKTAAFSIPIVAKLIEDPKATALVLAPTRELAVQISDVIKKLCFNVPGLNSALLIGGSPMGKQMHELSRKPRVIVATPGRLNDHLLRKTAHLNNVKILVLDEADRMLDMGFEPQIKAILSFVPKERQILLFSATMPDRVRQLANSYLKSPERINVGSESKPVEKIRHSILQAKKAERNDILIDTLNARTGSILIFVNTKHGTDRLVTYLAEYGYPVTKIHGGRSQGQRNVALAGFRSKKFKILVATDVAARGLDVPHIEHVINYDLPKDVDDYVHRIGRTARAGAEGEAICFVTPEDRNHWNKICKIYKIDHAIGDTKKPRFERGAGGDGRREEPRKEERKTHPRDFKRADRPSHQRPPAMPYNDRQIVRDDRNRDPEVRQAKKEFTHRKEEIKEHRKGKNSPTKRAAAKTGGSTPWWLKKRIDGRDPTYKK